MIHGGTENAKSLETSFNPSSVVLITVGSISIANAMPPASALNVVPRIILLDTIVIYTTTPAIIDGTPDNTFVPNLMNWEKLPPFEYSARYIPPPIPIGIDINPAINVIINVPIIALPIPPADISSPGG